MRQSGLEFWGRLIWGLRQGKGTIDLSITECTGGVLNWVCEHKVAHWSRLPLVADQNEGVESVVRVTGGSESPEGLQDPGIV